jgi:hypothetical protein
MSNGTLDRLKWALDGWSSACAAHSNRLHALDAVRRSGLLTDEQFLKVVGQAPGTIERDVMNAKHEFQRAKAEYELFCREIGVPAYGTYNED